MAFGLLLGLRHATDPDHVVAVGAIATAERSMKRIALVGASWGAGHTATVLTLGGAVILLDVRMPIRLGLGLELAVAVMLGVIGIVGVARFLRRRPSATPLAPAAQLPARPRGWARSFGIGLVHGVAGSTAAALLMLSLIADRVWAFVYLAVFALGTLAGMVLVTSLIALPVTVAASRSARLHRYIAIGSAAVSLLMGTWLAYQVCAAGLFGALPAWTPR